MSISRVIDGAADTGAAASRGHESAPIERRGHAHVFQAGDSWTWSSRFPPSGRLTMNRRSRGADRSGRSSSQPPAGTCEIDSITGGAARTRRGRRTGASAHPLDEKGGYRLVAEAFVQPSSTVVLRGDLQADLRKAEIRRAHSSAAPASADPMPRPRYAGSTANPQLTELDRSAGSSRADDVIEPAIQLAHDSTVHHGDEVQVQGVLVYACEPRPHGVLIGDLVAIWGKRGVVRRQRQIDSTSASRCRACQRPDPDAICRPPLPARRSGSPVTVLWRQARVTARAAPRGCGGAGGQRGRGGR